MAEEMKEEKGYSVDATKEFMKAKKEKAKGRGITYEVSREPLAERVAKVEEKRKRILTEPGDPKLLARARSMGKLTARERIDRLFGEVCARTVYVRRVRFFSIEVK